MQEKIQTNIVMHTFNKVNDSYCCPFHSGLTTPLGCAWVQRNKEETFKRSVCKNLWYELHETQLAHTKRTE